MFGEHEMIGRPGGKTLGRKKADGSIVLKWSLNG